MSLMIKNVELKTNVILAPMAGFSDMVFRKMCLDYGAGIAQKDIDRIFNRYYSAAKKFRKIGTGLGLYLALQVSRAHNGDLTVDSKEGEYSEFCIKIPVNYEKNSILY